MINVYLVFQRIVTTTLCFLWMFLLSSPIAFAQKSITSKHAMVVTEHYLASQIGNQILLSGGNAIDAAVAVGYALAVVQPCCGNIGGGGFATLHLAKGKNIFLNFREKAPLAATSSMFLNKKGKVIPGLSTRGYLAVAIPGTVLGFETLLKKYGTKTRQEVMAPAIQLAKQGFTLTAGDLRVMNPFTREFVQQPNVAKIFLKQKGKPYQVGDRFIQTDLANTLQLISKYGASIFYKGKIAQDMVKASQQHNGILSLNDFAKYQIEIVSPLSCTYNDYTLISSPPPSSGGVTLCEALNILESYPLKKFGFHTVKSTHYIVEALRFAFYDRNHWLGDPNFVKNPVDKLISKDYADYLRQQILDVKATPSYDIKTSHQTRIKKLPLMRNPIKEGITTTHYSIVDKWGNAISVTYTLNSYFGAKIMAGNTGFFLNNEMDDFSVKNAYPNKFGLVESNTNAIQPGKRPLSSMTPTILTKDNKVVMLLGSPGGPRIISSVLETILNVLSYGMTIQDAVNQTRFHHQWLPDIIYFEPHTFTAETREKLIEMGYHFALQPTIGAVEAIYIHPETKLIEGINDRRCLTGLALGN